MNDERPLGVGGYEPESLADYYEILYLKRGDSGMYAPFAVQFPKLEEAEAHAAQLRLGSQGAVVIKPRRWE